MGDAAASFRNRIVGEGEEAPDQLLANPLNFRRHTVAQLDALRGLLKEVGWVQRVVVNQRTGHIVDGHGRVELALREGEPVVHVVYVDLSEEEERKVLASMDEIGSMAYKDGDVLAALLEGLSTEDAALAAVVTSLNLQAGTLDPALLEPMAPVTGPQVPADHAVIRVKVRRLDKLQEAMEAVGKLVAENGEWDAKVEH